jgi:hypothetical protein
LKDTAIAVNPTNRNAPAAPPLDATNAAYAAQMGFQAPQQ